MVKKTGEHLGGKHTFDAFGITLDSEEENLDPIPFLPHTCFVTLAKLIFLSKTQLSHLQNEGNAYLSTPLYILNY